MISKEIIEGVSHVFVLFGDGTVMVSSAFPEGMDSEPETDLILSQIEGPQPIGINQGKEGVPSTELDKPIILRFNKSESVDVVLDVLHRIKDNLAKMENKPEHAVTHEECCCFKCDGIVHEKSSPDCACEESPIYGESCNACPKKAFCDVPKNPELYGGEDV